MSLLKVAGTTASSGTLYVNDVFSTYLYTGNGSTQTITNGIDLAGKGGMVWIKSRTSANDHVLTDTARGVTNGAIKSNTAAQAQGTTTYITSFNSNGYNLAFYDGIANTNGYNYASWTFRKAAKFFDVVTWTGNGSARTIAHSLGVAPGMIIVKRTDTTGNWQVYHRSLTSAAYSMQLNLSNAQASAPTVWNSTAPTSSVFSVGTSVDTNDSGGTYVAYLYAHDTSSTGIIQCGSFTTDGSGNATVNLGWEPQYLLTKRSDSTGYWVVVDTMRGFSVATGGGSDAQLYPNDSAAENFGGANINGGYPTATGFYANNGFYSASANYIYMAIRMPNKPPTTGTQVFSPIARTGTGAAATVTGANFPPDAVLSTARVDQVGTGWFDRLRGKNLPLNSSNTDAEVTATTNELLTYNMDGYSAGASSYGYINTSTYTYANWMFRRAPRFFDEVCYTGTGSATTQAHNLTVVPELMIVKERSAINDWWVYVSSVGNTKYSVLNSTAIPTTSSTAWNNTTPTASVFSIGTGSNVNASAQTFVAYLFATLAGISKVGSYTGNGTGQAIACGFSGGARFVLIKRTDAAGAWYTFDSARGLTVGSSPYLLLNSTAAEVTGNNGVYASTGGFTLGSTASTTTNINGASYIYLSVA